MSYAILICRTSFLRIRARQRFFKDENKLELVYKMSRDMYIPACDEISQKATGPDHRNHKP